MSATGPTGTSNNGAVISGRVTMTGNAATSVGTTIPLALLVVPMATSSAGSVTVTIVGTGASTTIDGNGSFTLDNVPPGSVQLRFQGRGSDAMLTISGIEADDHIAIAVTLNGNNARLDAREKTSGGNGNEVNGRIDAIDAGARTLRVNGMTVVVPASTAIRHGNRTFAFADLRIGDHIQVKGSRNGSTVTASEVKVETEGEDDEDDNNNGLSGAVSALSGTCPAVSFVVAGTRGVTSATTRFEDGSCSGLRNDVRVEVDGTRAGDTLMATKVEFD